ncbi:heme transporter hrg1-A-like [Lampetra fluviatilis]
MAVGRTALRLRLAMAVLGFLFGVAVFCVWIFVYEQIWTATLGGLSGVLALWVFVTHAMYLQDYWRSWLRGLRYFLASGVLASLIALTGSITMLALACHRQETMKDPRSLYWSALASALALLWALLLAAFSFGYRREFAEFSLLMDF